METNKANVFNGTDTYGKNITVGIRKDGKAFYKVYRYNGYGMSDTKWMPCDVEFEIQHDKRGAFIKWGWNEFKGWYNPRIRLPK
jgi:hypothetical protein